MIAASSLMQAQAKQFGAGNLRVRLRRCRCDRLVLVNLPVNVAALGQRHIEDSVIQAGVRLGGVSLHGGLPVAGLFRRWENNSAAIV